jgi:hypothetical protein
MPIADLGGRGAFYVRRMPTLVIHGTADEATMSHGLAGWRIVDRAYRVPLKKS